MARRRSGAISLPCGHPSCVRVDVAEWRTERGRSEWEAKRATWRCTKHRNIDALLAPNNTTRTVELVASRVDGCAAALFWLEPGKKHGFSVSHGPGFYTDANDWPEGTVLRITAAILLPEVSRG